MKNKLLLNIVVFALFFLPKFNSAQAPPLGLASGFALFTGVGGVTNVNTPRSQITGNVGTNAGAFLGFGNINGQMQNGNAITLQCSSDVAAAYSYLGATVSTYFHAPLLNGQTFLAGVHAISGPSTLTTNLNLDAQNNASAVFVIKIPGTFGTGANATVTLLNGAQSCNVFWKIDGATTMATNTSFKGTIVSNSAITLGVLSKIDGRILTTVGLIYLNGVSVTTPIGCGSPILMGPAAPNMGTVGCFELFSGIGQLSNPGASANITGKIGANGGGAPTGFGSAPGPVEYNNPVTAQATVDLTALYNSLKAGSLPYDIELLYPAQFGNNQTLTPHVYRMNTAASLTDSLTLDARGNPSAIFVFQINGGFNTINNSKIKLAGQAKASNVFWVVEGATTLGTNSILKGTIISNNGAITPATGAMIDGRLLTTVGAIVYSGSAAALPLGNGPCGGPFIVLPIAVRDTISTLINTQKSIGVLANDININMSIKTLSIKTQPAHGTAVLTAGGDSIRYTPAINYTGLDSLYYKICTGTPSRCDSAWAVINVTPPVNLKPIANRDTTSTLRNIQKRIGVLRNDLNINYSSFILSIKTSPLHGSVALTAGGDSLIYTPALNYTGMDSLYYKICTGVPSQCDSAWAVINVLVPANPKPVAVRDTENTFKNTQKKIAVLNNDLNIIYSSFNLNIKTLPLHGIVALTAGGDSVLYTPALNYLGLDSFYYKICTGVPTQCDSAWAVINVVLPPNIRPDAVNDITSTFKNTLKKIGVLANDNDPDGNSLTVSIITLPVNGTAVLTGDSISYTPNLTFRGKDSLQYKICDNGIPSLCDSAWVFITITNRRPIALNDTAATFRNTLKKIAILNNDSEPDGDPLTISLLTAPRHGTVTFINDTANYLPNSSFVGMDSLRYKICDNQTPSLCDSAWVFIRVLPVIQGGGGGLLFADGNISICYSVFTALGNITNTGATTIVGDIGTNFGTISGLTPAMVSGAIHSTPDSSTSHVAGDINSSYAFYGNLTPQETLTPSQFGNNLVLVPRVYRINGSITLTDSVTFSAQNNPDALFVIQVNGAFTMGIASKIILKDSARASNIIWKIDGATSLGANSIFKGTIFGNNTITIGSGVNIEGRAFTSNGNITLNVSNVHLPKGLGPCGAPTTNSAPFAVNDTVTTPKNVAVNIDVTANDWDPNGDALLVSLRVLPKNGTAVLSASNHIYYTPNTGFVGLDSLRYKICDDGIPTLCDSAWVFITVGPNIRPVAVNDTAKTNKNTVVTIDVRANDFDANNDPLIVSILTAPLHGTAIMVGNNVRYTPNSNFTGWDTLRYRICDDGIPVYCDSALVFINTVTNNAPIAVNDTLTTLFYIPVTINVTANDSDPDGDSLSVSLLVLPLHGTAVLSGRNVIYTPNLLYFGLDSFSYKICDSGTPTLCDSAWVFINTVTNRAPLAVDDYVKALKNFAQTIVVTANDSDPDGNLLTVSIIGSPKHGTVFLVGNDIRYSPDFNYLGLDSFPYQICDNGSPVLCDQAWVYVNTVTNRAPFAVDDYVTTHKNTEITVNVTANDSDPDGDPLTVTILRYPNNGGAIVVGINIRYTPNIAFGGTDSLLYQICDNRTPSLCDSAWVFINVSDNRAPLAVDDYTTMFRNTIANINVTANDFDPDGDPLTASIQSSPMNGVAIMVGNNVRYTPNINFTGADSLSYQVCDNQNPSLCDLAWVYINVLNNRRPDAEDDFVITPTNFPVTVNVTANDVDPDGDALTVSILGIPAHGNIILLGNNIRYSPNSGYIGSDSFPYKVCDNGSPSLCDSAWVYINVISLTTNRPPVAINDNISICNDGGSISVLVQSNDSDPDLDALTTGIAAGPYHGTATLIGNAINYKPNVSYSGSDTITYYVCDNRVPSLCATAYLLITVNQRPGSLSVAEQSICAGSGIVIGKPAVAGNTYLWSPITGLSSPLISQPLASPVVTTDYTLTETITATGCSNSSTIKIIVNPLPLAITGSNQTIYDVKSATIGAAPVANHTYSWSPALGLNFPNISKPVARPSVTTTYTLTETDTMSGCTKSNSVTIFVVELEFYTGFSPNGDGSNDFWKIPVLDIYTDNQVSIINRWGNEVWHTSDYNNLNNFWDGKNNNGVDLPDGTYYYILIFNNEEQRGWVVLKR